MPYITLDKSKTALLIADFYRDMMNIIPHAVERQVAEFLPSHAAGLPLNDDLAF